MESLWGGGAEKVLVNILNNINYKRYHIDLCLLVKEGVYLPDVPVEVKVSSLLRNRLTYRIIKRLSKILRTDLFYRIIVNNKIKEKYDIEISFLEGPSLKFHSLIKSSAYKVTWIHCNLNIQRWWERHFHSHNDARNAYLKMDKLIFVSHDALKEFNILFKSLEKEKQVLYNPINKTEIVSKALEFEVSKKRLTICTIGRLQPQKSYHLLIEAVSMLNLDKIEFDLWIIGTGPLEHNLKKLASKYKISNNIAFLGFKKNPYPYLRSADIFVNTSTTEGFPLVIAEAVSLGKAIVATSVTGTTEILNNGNYGILTTHDPTDIYMALKGLILNAELRKEYETKAKKRSEMFDLNESMKRFEELINPTV